MPGDVSREQLSIGACLRQGDPAVGHFPLASALGDALRLEPAERVVARACCRWRPAGLAAPATPGFGVLLVLHYLTASVGEAFRGVAMREESFSS